MFYMQLLAFMRECEIQFKLADQSLRLEGTLNTRVIQATDLMRDGVGAMHSSGSLSSAAEQNLVPPLPSHDDHIGNGGLSSSRIGSEGREDPPSSSLRFKLRPAPELAIRRGELASHDGTGSAKDRSTGTSTSVSVQQVPPTSSQSFPTCTSFAAATYPTAMLPSYPVGWPMSYWPALPPTVVPLLQGQNGHGSTLPLETSVTNHQGQSAADTIAHFTMLAQLQQMQQVLQQAYFMQANAASLSSMTGLSSSRPVPAEAVSVIPGTNSATEPPVL